MSLNDILDQIEKNKPNAEMDLNFGNPNTYNGRLGVKRASVENIKRLKLQYRNELMSSSVFIIVTGSGRDTFTELATSEAFGCFSYDPENFYKDVISRLDSRVFGREGAKGLFNIADNCLREKAMELDIASYPSLSFNDKYNASAKTPEEFLPLLRTAINDQVGSEIVGIDAVHSVVTQAIEKKHAAQITPIVLSTPDEKFGLDLLKNLKKRQLSNGTYTGFSDKVFMVTTGKVSKTVLTTEGVIGVKTVNEETVSDALSKIRNQIM